MTIPVPKASSDVIINGYGGETPTLRLLCSITGKLIKYVQNSEIIQWCVLKSNGHKKFLLRPCLQNEVNQRSQFVAEITICFLERKLDVDYKVAPTRIQTLDDAESQGVA